MGNFLSFRQSNTPTPSQYTATHGGHSSTKCSLVNGNMGKLDNKATINAHTTRRPLSTTQQVQKSTHDQAVTYSSSGDLKLI